MILWRLSFKIKKKRIIKLRGNWNDKYMIMIFDDKDRIVFDLIVYSVL